MLVALWSPKGGSGTSVLAAACAVVLARHGGVRLADLDGDQPAIFGLATDPVTGLADWLATGPEAPPDALDRLTVEAAPGVALVPRGAGAGLLAPPAAAEAGAALAVTLRDGPVPCVVDAGSAAAPAGRALVEVADVSVVVLRGCYLSLRRAVHSPLLARAAGIAASRRRAVRSARRSCATCSAGPSSPMCRPRARSPGAVDAGVLASRLPEPLARGHGAAGQVGSSVAAAGAA